MLQSFFFAYRYQLVYACMMYNFSALDFSKSQLWYADTLCGFTVPELFLHRIFKWDMLELYINTPTTHVAQNQCYNWTKLSTIICWKTVLFRCSTAVFIYGYKLWYESNVYKLWLLLFHFVRRGSLPVLWRGGYCPRIPGEKPETNTWKINMYSGDGHRRQKP